MDNPLPILKRAGLFCFAIFLASCEKPQLVSEKNEEREPELETVAPKTPDNRYVKIREGVIGQTFATLTLGAQVFSNVEVLDITDEEIVIRHAGGEELVPWSDVPNEVRERWGYDPATGVADYEPPKEDKSLLSKLIPKKAEEELPDPSVAPATKRNEREIAQQVAVLRQRMDAQLTGIRTMESDLAQQSRTLYALRSQLQTIRAQQSNQRTNGVRVERIGGETSVVNRSQQAQELEKQIRAAEPLVAQLTNALNSARQEYQKLQGEVDALLRE